MVKSFFNKLISSNEDVSSKRFVGIVAFFVIAIIAFIDLFSDFTISTFVFDALETICISGLSLTSLEKIFEARGKKQNENG